MPTNGPTSTTPPAAAPPPTPGQPWWLTALQSTDEFLLDEEGRLLHRRDEKHARRSVLWNVTDGPDPAPIELDGDTLRTRRDASLVARKKLADAIQEKRQRLEEQQHDAWVRMMLNQNLGGHYEDMHRYAPQWMKDLEAMNAPEPADGRLSLPKPENVDAALWEAFLDITTRFEPEAIEKASFGLVAAMARLARDGTGKIAKPRLPSAARLAAELPEIPDFIWKWAEEVVRSNPTDEGGRLDDTIYALSYCKAYLAAAERKARGETRIPEQDLPRRRRRGRPGTSPGALPIPGEAPTEPEGPPEQPRVAPSAPPVPGAPAASVGSPRTPKDIEHDRRWDEYRAACGAVGAKLKAWRQVQGLTQTKAAALIGLKNGASTWSWYERTGYARDGHVKKLEEITNGLIKAKDWPVFKKN